MVTLTNGWRNWFYSSTSRALHRARISLVHAVRRNIPSCRPREWGREWRYDPEVGREFEQESEAATKDQARVVIQRGLEVHCPSEGSGLWDIAASRGRCNVGGSHRLSHLLRLNLRSTLHYLLLLSSSPALCILSPKHRELQNHDHRHDN